MNKHSAPVTRWRLVGRVVSSAAYLAMWAALLPLARAEPLTPAAQLITRPRVLIIAHRGYSAQAPENTLPAFRAALAAGADLVELDYYHSADDVPVVFHDKELDRTTDAVRVLGRKKVPVGSLTASQLQRLDAGTWFDVRFRNTRIPTLDEALSVIQSGSMTLIERKAGDPATCVQMLRRKQILKQVVVQSFDWDYVRECHRLAPDLTLAALGSKELTAQRLAEIQQTGAQVVGWSEKDLRPEDIGEIHQRGLKVWVYTVNDPQRAQHLIESGIDGLITDNPGLIGRVKSEG